MACGQSRRSMSRRKRAEIRSQEALQIAGRFVIERDIKSKPVPGLAFLLCGRMNLLISLR